MRIPYEDSPKVAPRALPETQQRVGADTGVGDLAAGLARAGQGAGSVGELVMSEYKKARDEADHTAVNNQLARLQDEHTSTLDGNAQQAAQQHLQSVQNLGGGGKTLEQQAGPSAAAAMSGADVPGRTVTVGLPGGFNHGPTDTSAKDAPRGFLYTRGEEAVAGSGVAITHLQAVQAQLRKELTNNRQRTLFDAQARGIYESGRRQVERHVSQQVQVAKEASLEARKASALTAIANNYGDDAGTADQMKSVEASIRSLAVSKEDGDHRVAEWEAAAVSTRLNQYLSNEDWKGAESLFAQAKDKLGPHAAQYEKQITEVRDNGQAEQLARSALKLATDANGKVDTDYALSVVETQTGDNVKLLDKSRRRVEEGAVQLKHAYDAETKALSDTAYAAFNRRGLAAFSQPYNKSTLGDELNQRNPDLYDRLVNEADLRWRRSKASNADARRAQHEADLQALNDYRALSDQEIAETDPAEFAIGRGVSPVGLSALGPVQKAASTRITNGQSVKREAFKQEATNAAAGVITGKNALKTYQGVVGSAYDDFVTKNGRAPTQEEARQLIIDNVGKDATNPWLGGIFHTEERGYEKTARERKNGKPAVAQPGNADDDLLASPPAVVTDGKNRKAVPAENLKRFLEANPSFRRE